MQGDVLRFARQLEQRVFQGLAGFETLQAPCIAWPVQQQAVGHRRGQRAGLGDEQQACQLLGTFPWVTAGEDQAGHRDSRAAFRGRGVFRDGQEQAVFFIADLLERMLDGALGAQGGEPRLVERVIVRIGFLPQLKLIEGGFFCQQAAGGIIAGLLCVFQRLHQTLQLRQPGGLLRAIAQEALQCAALQPDRGPALAQGNVGAEMAEGQGRRQVVSVRAGRICRLMRCDKHRDFPALAVQAVGIIQGMAGVTGQVTAIAMTVAQAFQLSRVQVRQQVQNAVLQGFGARAVFDGDSVSRDVRRDQLLMRCDQPLLHVAALAEDHHAGLPAGQVQGLCQQRLLAHGDDPGASQFDLALVGQQQRQLAGLDGAYAIGGGDRVEHCLQRDQLLGTQPSLGIGRLPAGLEMLAVQLCRPLATGQRRTRRPGTPIVFPAGAEQFPQAQCLEPLEQLHGREG